MVEPVRKKSPRAPSISLDEALERVMKVYEKERVHAAPTEVFAQHIGYKTANNGTALQAIASMRYYGLVDRPRDGFLAATKEVEAYKFAPSPEIQLAFLRQFLRKPQIFAELLDTYATGLPSDGTLKYDLINRGFLPSTAATLVNVLKRSVEFAKYFDSTLGGRSITVAPASEEVVTEAETDFAAAEAALPVTSRRAMQQYEAVHQPVGEDGLQDRIPVRLKGGRRAWLVIPQVFYEADKARLRAQIDLLLTEDDE